MPVSDIASSSSGVLSLERLAINQITTKNWGLIDAVRGYARHGVRSIAVWRDKLANCGLRQARQVLDDNGMGVVALTPVYVPLTVDEAVQSDLDEILRAFEDAATIGAQSVLMLASPPAKLSPSTIKNVLCERLEMLADRAPPQLELVLEPLHPINAATVSPLTTLRDAVDICEQIPRIGLAVDVYNVWWDWDLEGQIARAGRRIKGFHVSDWLPEKGDPRYNRGMMGDGCIDIPMIRGWVESAGYNGPVEVEIFSEQWWARDPDEVVKTCVDRFARDC
jgi:sugar phosphate isomerase/epimerase